MATDEYLLDRLRNTLTEKKVGWIEKRMFGGVCFMVNDKMCFGTFSGGLMARVGPDESENLLDRDGATQMMQKNRVMKGYILVMPEGYDTEEQLDFWIQKCIDFNPRAKSSKKKKKAL